MTKRPQNTQLVQMFSPSAIGNPWHHQITAPMLRPLRAQPSALHRQQSMAQATGTLDLDQ